MSSKKPWRDIVEELTGSGRELTNDTVRLIEGIKTSFGLADDDPFLVSLVAYGAIHSSIDQMLKSIESYKINTIDNIEKAQLSANLKINENVVKAEATIVNLSEKTKIDLQTAGSNLIKANQVISELKSQSRLDLIIVAIIAACVIAISSGILGYQIGNRAPVAEAKK